MNAAVAALAACLVGVAALWGAGRLRWAARTRALLDRLDAARASAAHEPVDPRELDNVPPPVARYLRQVLPARTHIVRAVDVAHRGTFNTRQTGERWKRFTSRQRVVTRRPGFVWDGRVAILPGLTVHVHDAYVDGEGVVEPAIAGLFTLMSLKDRHGIARGELMRFLAEAAWYPTALLPSQGVRWTAVDDHRARATLVDGELGVTVTFHFGADGLVEAIRADARARAVDGQFVATPWEARVSNYQWRDGLRVPVDGEVAWLTAAGRLPYWRGTISELIYHR